MRFEGPEKFLIISTIVLGILGIISYLDPQVGTALNNTITAWFVESIKSENLIYLYLIAAVSVTIANASVFIYIPYPLILFALAAKPEVNPVILILSASIGAAFGEFSAYLIGFVGKRVTEDIEKYRKKSEIMRKLLEQKPLLIPFIIFLMALTPLPDDVILIPLGFVGYSFTKAIIACFLGKLTLITIIILGGKIFGGIILHWFSTSGESPYPWLDDIIIIYIVVIIIYVILKIDFSKLAKRLGVDIKEASED